MSGLCRERWHACWIFLPIPLTKIRAIVLIRVHEDLIEEPFSAAVQVRGVGWRLNTQNVLAHYT